MVGVRPPPLSDARGRDKGRDFGSDEVFEGKGAAKIWEVHDARLGAG